MSTPNPRRIALVGCGKKKLARAAPARELYTGPLFRAALAVAEAEFGEDVWVLSAQHGLVDLDEQLEPYDFSLEGVSAVQRAAWAKGVLSNLVDEEHDAPAHLTVYAGEAYVSALEQMLPLRWTLDDPLYALSQGERLAWLKSRLQQLLSPTPSNDSAVPAGAAPKESAVSTPTTRLTQQQREEHFHLALEVDNALAEIPLLRERALRALAEREELLRKQRQASWHAATTGEDPDARPQQQSLLGELAAPPAPAPVKEEPREPEPPPAAKRTRRKPTTTEAKGTKRAPEATAARTATVAEATPVEDDAVPAPQVPCCTRGDSLAQHKSPRGELGACRAENCSAKPRCKAFQLGRVYGWTLHWRGGWRETANKPVFWLAPADALLSGEFILSEKCVGPLFVGQDSLLHSDPSRPELVTDALERARRTGSWSEDEGGPSVPLRVLEAIAAVLLPPEAEEPAPEAVAGPTEPAPAPAESLPVVDLDSINPEEVSDLRQVLKQLKGKAAQTSAGVRLRKVLSVLAISAREESWCYLVGDEQRRVHLVSGEVWLSRGTRALETAGPWLWDGMALLQMRDWSSSRVRGRGEHLEALEAQLRTTLQRWSPSTTEVAPSAPSPEGWRVELPERSTSHSIIHLWLVNDSTGEKRTASWWSISGLKPSHHLAGKLEGEALAAHLALNAWWAEHPEVVQDMEAACREGRVPGLRVGEPPEPLQDGPFFYALSGNWRLETADDGENPTAHLVEPGGDHRGPFQWRDGALVAEAVSSAVWANANTGRLKEAEDFIRRGFVTEFRRVAGGAA